MPSLRTGGSSSASPSMAGTSISTKAGETFRHSKYKSFTLEVIVDEKGTVTNAISHQGFADYVMKRR